MYKIITAEDKVRVPPAKFGLHLKEAVKSSLEDRFEGITDRNHGIILAITEVSEVGEGRILPGDGAIYYPVTFRALVYKPELHEIVSGNVIDVTEFGVFVRIGPVDGMVHVSQIMDDFVSYDPKNFAFTGKETRNSIKEGDTVMSRIISVSLEKEYKIGLTLRQAGLGASDWVSGKQVRETRATRPEKKDRRKRR